MKPRTELWDELQSRWSAGERLSPLEERMRLEHAATDELARREIELFLALADELRDPGVLSPDSPEVDRIVETLRDRRLKRLRLVTPDDAPAVPTEAPRRTRRIAAFGGAASLAVAAAVALWIGFDRSPAAEATRSAPHPAAAPVAGPGLPEARSELVLSAGEVWVGASPGAVGRGTLKLGDRVRTGHGRACFTIDMVGGGHPPGGPLDPTVDVCLEEQSEALVESLHADDLRVRVVRGTAVAALAKLPAGHRLSLESGELRATARGTVFAVEAAAGRAASVAVVEGSVEVRSGTGEPTIVPAHTRLRASGSSAPAEPTAIGRSEEARIQSLLAARELWQGATLGVLEVTGGGSEVSIDGRGPFVLPMSTFASVGRRLVTLRDGAGNEHETRVEVVAGETRSIDAVAATRSAGADAAPPSAQDLLDQARRELAQGHEAAALSLYRRLSSSFPGSPEAATVLITMGKLELGRNSPARALTAFDSYLKRGGPLEPEALSGKIRALRALGRTAQERDASLLYLRRYPNGFDAPSLRKRVEPNAP